MKRICFFATLAVVLLSCSTDDGEIESGQDTAMSHEYVDLDLPSGTLWATCNVGASSPEDYGDFYAWGETETKSTYSWNNYKWGTKSSLTKYISHYAYGTVDNREILEPSDDVAHVKWGGSWRMPTIAEFEELVHNCTRISDTVNGVNGYRFTSKRTGNTHKSIFLPATPVMKQTIEGLFFDGGYWSSTLRNSKMGGGSQALGFFLALAESSVAWGIYDRALGMPVRPVMNK